MKGSNPFGQVKIFGLILAFLAAVIIFISPPKSEQTGAHSSQIVAFEFVDNPEELDVFFNQLCEGRPEKRTYEEHCQERKSDIDKVNYIDFVMMIAYGLFLFGFADRIARITGESILNRAKYLAPLAVIFDALENAQMLNMTKSYPEIGDYVYTCLSIFTRLKWLLLALLLAVIGYSMRGMIKSKWLGYFLPIPTLAGVIALFTDGHLWIEIWTLSISISFMLLLIYCLTYRPPQAT